MARSERPSVLARRTEQKQRRHRILTDHVSVAWQAPRWLTPLALLLHTDRGQCHAHARAPRGARSCEPHYHHRVRAGEAGGCRASYAGMGFLIRPPLPAEAARLYAAERNRGQLPHATEQAGHPGLNHTSWPLQNQGGSRLQRSSCSS